jgi:hypothetical protein
MAINEDGVLVTGGDDGSLCFWDWKTGHLYQRTQTIVQPGTLTFFLYLVLWRVGLLLGLRDLCNQVRSTARPPCTP